MRLVLGGEFLEARGVFRFLGIETLLEFIKLPTQFLGTFFLGLLLTYLFDGSLDLGIASTKDFLCLGTSIVDNLAMLSPDVVQALVIVGNQLVEMLLLGPHVLALVLPVTAVTHDVEQVFIHIDVVAAHNLACLVDDLLGQTRLTGNLDGK